jgi:alkylhydroperoxidase family enzyme
MQAAAAEASVDRATTTYRDRLRKLTLSDQTYLDAVLREGGAGASGELDPREASLVRIAAMIAIDAPANALDWAVSSAMAEGASPDEVVDVLIATAPVIGTARVVSAAQKLGLGMGYDVDADIEGLGAR